MTLPVTNLHPEFRISRASHVVLHVTDLQASRAFYEDILGFIVSDETNDCVYLRGLEEIAHHSITLKQGQKPQTEVVGMRCFTPEDLEKTEHHFRAQGLPTEWIDAPFQGRTLRTFDIAGTPLEFCATMDVRERMVSHFKKYQGICPLRLDHTQIFVPDVATQAKFYGELGFRLSEYITAEPNNDMIGAFMQVKGNPHDIVFLQAPGPQIHHTAFTVPEASHLMHVGDLLCEAGFFDSVEWGPIRHWGPGWARSLYLRDPDGHRLEFFTNHYQMIDLEEEPVAWSIDQLMAAPGWGPKPPETWMIEAIPFVGVSPHEPEDADAQIGFSGLNNDDTKGS